MPSEELEREGNVRKPKADYHEGEHRGTDPACLIPLLEMALEVCNHHLLFLTIGLLEGTRALSGMPLRLNHGHEYLAILLHGYVTH